MRPVKTLKDKRYLLDAVEAEHGFLVPFRHKQPGFIASKPPMVHSPIA
jgi:hypothetical protein